MEERLRVKLEEEYEQAVRTEVTVLLATGGTMIKVIYKVEPN